MQINITKMWCKIMLKGKIEYIIFLRLCVILRPFIEQFFLSRGICSTLISTFWSFKMGLKVSGLIWTKATLAEREINCVLSRVELAARAQISAQDHSLSPTDPPLSSLVLSRNLSLSTGDDLGDLSGLVSATFVFVTKGIPSFVRSSSLFTDHHRCPLHSVDDPSPKSLL